MKLGRLVTVHFTGSPEEGAPFSMKMGECDIEVVLRKSYDRGELLCVTGMVSLPYLPKITRERLVVVPEKSRIFAEDCLSHYAHLCALERGQPVSITSATPSVFLRAESEIDRQFLLNAVGIKYPALNSGFPHADYKLDFLKIDFGDRLDGVALLAQAIKSDRPSADFMAYMRLFERAFSTANGKLAEPLSLFLSGAKHQGYSRSEIDRWTGMRDGVSHADRPRKSVLLDVDVAWVVGRAKQAAYDVLANKLNWATPSRARRTSWVPVSGTTDPEAGLLATQGEDFVINMTLFDEFRRFPLNLNGNLTKLSQDWWDGRSREN